MTNKPKPLPNKIPEAIRAFAKERDMSLSELGRQIGLKSNHLQYVVGKRHPVSAALVGRFFIRYGDATITRTLAEACREE